MLLGVFFADTWWVYMRYWGEYFFLGDENLGLVCKDKWDLFSYLFT